MRRVYFFFFAFAMFYTSCSEPPVSESQSAIQTVVTGNALLDSGYWDPLFKYEDQLCQHLRCMTQTRDGALWFGTNIYGLIRYKNDTLKYFNDADGFSGGRLNGLHEDDVGNLWINTAEGLWKYDGDQFERFTNGEDYDQNELWGMKVVDDEFWLNTSAGISIFDGENYRELQIGKASVADTNTVISYDRVNCMMQDRDGVWWFGRDGFGITKWDGEEESYLTTKDGLPGNVISSLFQDSFGDVWVGTAFNGIVKLTDEGIFTQAEMIGLEGEEVGGFYTDRNGDLWLTSEHHGIYKYDGKTFTNYHEKQGLTTGGVICFMEDHHNRFWIGGWQGLYRFEGDSIVRVGRNGPWPR